MIPPRRLRWQKGKNMFKKFVEMLASAESELEVSKILYNVDMAYQMEKINWKDHELLFKLGGKIRTEG